MEELVILPDPLRKRRHSTLRKNIILHLAKHTQFITPQTGTSVRETSTLKHGSKYWKLLETLATFLLCFLNVGVYFASLSLTNYNSENATLLLNEEIASEKEKERKRTRGRAKERERAGWCWILRTRLKITIAVWVNTTAFYFLQRVSSPGLIKTSRHSLIILFRFPRIIQPAGPRDLTI